MGDPGCAESLTVVAGGRDAKGLVRVVVKVQHSALKEAFIMQEALKIAPQRMCWAVVIVRESYVVTPDRR